MTVERELPYSGSALSRWRDWLSRATHVWQKRATPEGLVETDWALPQELRPDSPLMNGCRTLRVSLYPHEVHGKLPSLLLLGTTPDPTRVLVAAGLAMTMAEEGRSTLLVDANLREPFLHTLFSLELSPGLTDQIARDDAATPTSAAIAPRNVRENLWVMPAGMASRDAAELLRMPSLAPLISAAAERFDAVIYHASSQWTYPDALLLAPRVGSVVLTIQGGVDSADQVRHIKSLLERAGVRILGFAFMDHGK